MSSEVRRGRHYDFSDSLLLAVPLSLLAQPDMTATPFSAPAPSVCAFIEADILAVRQLLGAGPLYHRYFRTRLNGAGTPGR